MLTILYMIPTPQRFLFLAKRLLCLALMLLSAACAGKQAGDLENTVNEAFRYFNGDYNVSESFKKNPPQSIAVGPFWGDRENFIWLPEDFSPETIVRESFYGRIAVLPFRDVELAAVDARLAQAGLQNPQEIQAAAQSDPKRLQDALKVDALVLGEITHFDRVYAGVVSQAAVGCKIWMYELATGEVLWQAEHVSRNLEGVLTIDPIGIIIDGVTTLWNARRYQLFRQTDEAVREIVSTIAGEIDPTTVAEFSRRKSLDIFVLMNSEKVYAAGRALTFRALGDDELKPHVEIPGSGLKTDLLPMPKAMHRKVLKKTLESLPESENVSSREMRKEFQKKQIYEGYIIVPEGIELTDASARCTVSGADGDSSVYFLPETFDLDGKSPSQVQKPKVESGNAELFIHWQAAPEPDVAGYVLSLQLSDSTEPTSITTPSNIYTAKGLPNFRPIQIRIRARDAAGNLGPPSRMIRAEASPIPENVSLRGMGPDLGGTIAENVLLTAAKSPYTVREDLVVSSAGALYVEPGVQLRFAPETRMIISGGKLHCYGTAENPVIFRSTMEAPAPGAFGGVVLKGASAEMQHVVIDSARVGLTVEQSAPALTATAIRHSSQAGLLLREGAKPAVNCSHITDNQGMGGLVAEGNANPRIRNTIFRNNVPFHVQNYASLPLDLHGNIFEPADAAGHRFLGEVLSDPEPISRVECTTTKPFGAVQ